MLNDHNENFGLFLIEKRKLALGISALLDKEDLVNSIGALTDVLLGCCIQGDNPDLILELIIGLLKAKLEILKKPASE